MKRYLISLLVLTLVAIIAAMAVAVFKNSWFSWVLPLTAIYFAVVTLVEHLFISRAAKQSPRTFIKTLMTGTIVVLFVHIIVMMIWLFSHKTDFKVFIVGFCICYMLYLAFETIALSLFVRRSRKEQEAKELEDLDKPLPPTDD